MGLEIKIIINDRFTSHHGSHKYRATPEQIQRNRNEIAAQRKRDQRAHDEANRITDANAAEKK